MQIGVAISGYGYEEETKRCIESCWRYVDLIFYCYGRYPDYPLIRPKPELNGIPNLVNLELDALESDKRNLMNEKAALYGVDFLIIMDTDEYIHPEVSWLDVRLELQEKCKKKGLYNCILYQEVGRMLLPTKYPRIIYGPGLVKYWKGHHYMMVNRHDSKERLLTGQDNILSLKICHDASLRTDEEKVLHDQWKARVRLYERQKTENESWVEKRNREEARWNC